MAKNVRIRLRKKEAIQKIKGDVKLHMFRAAIYLRDRVKIALNRSQPVHILPSGNIIGLNPSKPGEPPKKITGQLQASIIHDVRERGLDIIARVGSFLEKAAPLEFGSRDGKLKPRPYLRPSLIKNQKRIKQIIARGR